MIKWFEREFDFANNPYDLAALKNRLAGFPAKLETNVIKLPEAILSSGQWSIKEHIGHLGDLEPLWQGRLADIINGEKELRVTDLQNTLTSNAGHNNRSLNYLMARFCELRQQTIDQVERVTADDLLKFALHPRLKTPMRITDHLLFVAEHDEHHLDSILGLIP